LLHLLLLAKQYADALVGSRRWVLVFVLLLLWLARRVVASLPTCRPCSFSSSTPLVYLPCFPSTLCGYVCVVWFGRTIGDIYCLLVAKEESKNKILQLQIAGFTCNRFLSVHRARQGLFPQESLLQYTSNLLSLEPYIPFRYPAQSRPCLTTCFR
jgi:hypothetical protein